ncbi:type VI secretion protein IcmF/TssM N-terminal domain-containing protein [Vibrio fluminensis]|uniref:type VI secretion protein IcmF/TssM N-terminal domain-containing protein n=1 Tax=Vibrio fluminensis TaxID=2783614 RepID=UPI00188878C0|nr:type VI secretion protein IcmF/TssM N-terminal domain-containing protein [Vibrio fluminensis]
MMKNKKKSIFSGLFAVLVCCLIAFGFWVLGWYRVEPAWLVVLQTLAILLLLTVSWYFCFRFLSREKVNDEQKKFDIWRLDEIKRTFNVVWRKSSKLTRNPYALPWYVHLTENRESDLALLQQMGFERVEPSDEIPDELVAVEFWTSETAVIATINVSLAKESVTKSTQILFEQMHKKRARQVFNGAICTIAIGSLINRTEISVGELSQKYRSMLEEINRATGMVLPIYCLFSGMSQVKDLCELFSPLEESERDLPFGALRDVDESRHYEKVWFDQSYQRLVKGLANSLGSSLKHQLNSEYRDSVVAGIFQLSALRYDIEDFLSLTFNQHQLDDVELFFRGYFLVNTGGEGSSFDIVSAMHAADFGYESVSNLECQTKSLSLFCKGLFSQCISKEAALVGVNKKREFSYRTSRWGTAVCLVALLLGFLATMRAGYLYQQQLDQKALLMLEHFKENLRVNKIQPDDLASPVFSLFELREINQLYVADNHPWYASSWLPSSSIKKEVGQAYYRELKSELLTLMRDYIMKDMFVYNSLDDKVKTLELLNLQQILYNPNRHSTEPLIDYYISALNEEGSGYADLIDRFKLLAQDVLSTNAIPPEFDPQLLELVRSSLSTNDVSELLYQHILQHDQFSKRVDIRDKLNPRFEQLFQFSDGFSGYLIPFAFTSDGFAALSNETGFQLASQAIKAYEGVMGRINGDAEMNRINRQLRERYIKDYIRYWDDVTTNISLTEVNSWGGSELQLSLATDANFSPLLEFYQLVSDNTNLVGKIKHHQDQSSSDADSSETPAAKTDKVNSSGAMDQVAQSITYPFRHIHAVIKANDTGKSRYDIATSYLMALRDWVAKSKEIQFKGHYFLEQLQNADVSNPIAQLNSAADDYNVPVLPELMQHQASLVNGLALDAVREVINHDWAKVNQFYRSRLVDHYPFDPLSTTDAALTDVEAFFKPNGEFDSFAKKYANQLDITIDRELFINGFIPHQYLSLSWQYQPFNDAVARIQQQLFRGDKLGFQFAIKAVKMSPVVTRFSLMSSEKLFEYRNGPKLWRQQSWPIPSNQVQDIAILLEDSSGSIERDKQQGVWSWFRVADQMHGSDQVGRSEMIWRYQVGDNEVNLVVKSDGVGQPFDSSFFNKLRIPEWL